MLPWDMLFSCNIYLYAWNVATKDIHIVSSFLNRDTKFPAYIFMHHILIVSILWLEKNKLCLLGMEVPLNLLTGESLTVMGNVMNTGVKDLYESDVSLCFSFTTVQYIGAGTEYDIYRCHIHTLNPFFEGHIEFVLNILQGYYVGTTVFEVTHPSLVLQCTPLVDFSLRIVSMYYILILTWCIFPIITNI